MDSESDFHLAMLSRQIMCFIYKFIEHFFYKFIDILFYRYYMYHSCETSLHYILLQTLMVLFDQIKFRLNKTGLHMVDTWLMHLKSTLLTSRGCLDVTARALSREHGKLLSD